MSQNLPPKSSLLHSIENDRTGSSKSKASSVSTAQSVAVSTDQSQFQREVGSNTPNYAAQMAKALESGTDAEEFVQMLMQNEPSEAYWKVMTERRKQAIDETKIENQQLHNLIDDLNKENEQLRVLSNHCDYLQKILDSFTNEHDSLLDDSKIGQSR